MAGLRRAGCAAVVFAVLGFGSAGAAPPTPPFADGFPVTRSDSIYELDEVRRGDRGVGYTVFSGDEVAAFEVEVLGRMEDMLGPGRPVILARLSGEKIEFTGVIAGMSGSPVYIDGRLVGAVAYRFGSFSREPIAGITPIRSMLAARAGASAASANRPVRRVGSAGLSAEAIHGRDPSWLQLGAPATPIRDEALRPIALSVSASRLAPGAREVLARRLRGVGVRLGPAATGHAEIPGLTENEAGEVGGVTALPIAPASPIAAMLVKGDLNVAAIGTVTFVEGETVLAFGHPFVGFGRVDFPMATAGILNTLASEAGSYKQGIAAKEVGVIRDDRVTAIAGELGVAATMVPFTVRFTDARGEIETTEVEIVGDPFWLPMMLETVASSAIQGRLDQEVGGTVEAEIRVALEDRAIELEETYAAPPPTRVTAALGRDLGTVAAIIAQNELAEPRFRRIELAARYRTEVDILEIVNARPDRTVVEAGSTLGIDVDLRDFRGAVRTERVELPVPRGARGDASLIVAGGFEFDRHLERAIGRRRPTTLDGLLGLFAERRPTHRLVAGLFVDVPALTVGTVRHPSPPASWRTLIATTPERPVSRGRSSLGASVERELRAVVDGLREVEVFVRPPRDTP